MPIYTSGKTLRNAYCFLTNELEVRGIELSSANKSYSHVLEVTCSLPPGHMVCNTCTLRSRQEGVESRVSGLYNKLEHIG